ncbi:MAG: DUF1853 family protein [Gammaproteobacteria bacterium]|nr:DUF1853 family protein [Gammaproteobacteria bacterium]
MIYNHKLINDLAWVIGSPSLIGTADYNDQRLLTDSWFNNQLKNSANILSEEDKNPQRIQAYLSTMPEFKLGLYFEKLIHYWLSINPQFDIMRNNLIVSSEKITLGEFDFIIKDHQTGRTVHLEVAVKFFLEIINDKKSCWVGPNTRDRLDLKVDKLLNQQIELSNSSLVKSQLKQQNINIDDHWVILKGRLFKNSNKLESGCCWLSISDFMHSQNSDSLWLILDKPHWLSAISNVSEHFLAAQLYQKKELLAVLHETIDERPVCIAKIDDDKETKRFFITANDWQKKALNSLG